MPGIRRYVLADVERSRCTVHGAKAQFCMDGIKLLEYLCDFDERHSEDSKMQL